MTNPLSVGAPGQMVKPQSKTAATPSATNELVGGYYRQARQAADQVSVDYSRETKRHARDTVERLKKQISELSIVAVINPKGVARLIRSMARELGMAAKQYSDGGDPKALPTETETDAIGTAAATNPREALAAAYLQTDTHADDRRFVDDVQRLHIVLKSMMDGALSGAARSDGNDLELEDIARGFAESSDEISKATGTIEAWDKDAAPAVPFTPGTGGVLV